MCCLMVVGQILFPFWIGSSTTVPEEPFVSRVLMTWDTSRGFLRFVPFWSPHDSTGSQDNLGTLSPSHSVFGGRSGWGWEGAFKEFQSVV